MPNPAVMTAPESRRDCLERQTSAGIHWFTPAVEGDNRALEDWCANIGPPLAQSEPTADFSTNPGDSLDVLVWNVEVGDGWATRFLAENASIECAGPESRLTDGAPHFVLLAQEALRRSNDIPEDVVEGGMLPRVGGNANPGPLLDIIEVAERCGLSYFYLPGSRNGPDAFEGLREDKGNAILSTLPMSDLAGIELPFESVRRVVPVATLTTPQGERVRVASVHFITTPPPWRVVMTGNSARERQSLGLIDGLEKMEALFGPLSVVGAGDLNTFSHREVSMHKLRKYFQASPPHLGVPTRGPVQADHILFRRDALSGDPPDQIVPGSYERVDELYYSDHYPVRARVRFGNKNRAQS